MGHHIYIIDDNMTVVAYEYITFNFTSFSDRIEAGIYQMHGHTGKEVARICEKGLSCLREKGFSVVNHEGTTNPSLSEWWYGLRDRKEMDEAEFAGVYMCHLTRMRELALEYPDAIWVSDQVWHFTKSENEPYEPILFIRYQNHKNPNKFCRV